MDIRADSTDNKAGTGIAQALASENAHWYDKQGNPVYEVPRKDGNGMRPTTLADARKLFLFPSVTKVQTVAAKPGVEIYKATQLIESAMTLPKLTDEIMDAYAFRVIEDSKQHSVAAMGIGKELHKAIEDYIRGNCDGRWESHLHKLRDTLSQYGIDIFAGNTEHSFASNHGYGGKVDFHNDIFVIDWKTKDKLTEVVKTKTGTKIQDKKLAYPENVEQLSAYDKGLRIGTNHCRRLINVYVGADDEEIRIHEWPEQDAINGWEAFKALLRFWQIRNNYNGQTQ